jgi:hypothetical protein
MKLFEKIYTVIFYMKSGNVIVCDKVRSGTISINSVGAVAIRDFNQSKNAENALQLASIALDQIEAITTTKTKRIFAFNY